MINDSEKDFDKHPMIQQNQHLLLLLCIILLYVGHSIWKNIFRKGTVSVYHRDIEK